MLKSDREDGYSLKLRFRTTIKDGLLAIGQGDTYYQLHLQNGSLNLQTSLLNRLKGVTIGESLNDGNWQNVELAFNSSHIMIAASNNGVALNSDGNEQVKEVKGSWFSVNPSSPMDVAVSSPKFPLTFLGGFTPQLRNLAKDLYLTGCLQDVLLNDQWIFPKEIEGASVGCPRTAQCKPNPCQNAGVCADLWYNYECACQRPFLGKNCQFSKSRFSLTNLLLKGNCR